MKETILIVDEDVNARIIAETLLLSRGLPVRSALDGTEACDILSHPGASVVVLVVDLDLAVCGMSGWELLRRIQARFGGLPLAARPRILVLSSRPDPEVERFARQLGADAFLPKPVPPRQFVETVEQLDALAQARTLRQCAGRAAR